MKKTITHKIALYIRVSTEEQAANPEGSIKSQEQRLRQNIQFKNLESPFGEVVAVFIDRARSGKDTNRPELQKLLHAIRRQEISLVMVTELSRLSRSIKDFSDIWDLMRAHACEFQSLREQFDTTTAAGEMVLFTMANLAQFERKQVSERVKANFIARAERGLYNGGPIPLGYKLKPDKPGYLDLDHEHVPLVQEIFATFIREGCLSKAGKSLNDRGFRLKRLMEGGGGKSRLPHFTIGNLHQILTNRAYVGERRYLKNDEVKFAQACWEGIINPATFERVQKIMKKNRYRLKSYSEKRHNYLLSGLVFCDDCKDHLTGKSANGSGGKFFYYEHGAQTKRQAFLTKKFFTCRPGRHKAPDLEKRVWEEVFKILIEPSRAKKLLEMAKQAHSASGNVIVAQKLRGKIKGIEEQLESLAEHLAKIPKGVTPTPIFSQMKRLEEMKAKTQAELDGLVRTSTGFDLPIAFKSYEAFVTAARRLLDNPKAEEAKGKIIQKMVHKIEIKKDRSFRLHYYVGRDQIAVNHWALENQPQQSSGKEKGQALNGPALKSKKSSFL